MNIIQFNKYKKVQRDYESINYVLEYAKENNLEIAVCFKTEDCEELFKNDLDKNLTVSIISTNKDIINRLSNINYVNLENDE